MPEIILGRHDGLLSHRRLAWRDQAGGRLALDEAVLLLICGIAAAMLTDLIEFKLRLPGHAILRAVLPLSIGMALVPRRGAGTIMGVASLATSLVLRSSGGSEGGLGSITSTTLLGPLLDLWLSRARSGPWIYVGIIVAAVCANLLALGVQLGVKSFGGGGRSLGGWLPLALATYPACGALAGLVSAISAFRWRGPRDTNSP